MCAASHIARKRWQQNGAKRLIRMLLRRGGADRDQRLKMKHGSDADLEIILRAGIEHGANVVGFGAEGKAFGISPVCATTELQSETIFALACELRIEVGATYQYVRPRRQAGSESKA